MEIPAPFTEELAAFPAPLHELIVAELEAGNSIVELVCDFPAAAGRCLREIGNPCQHPGTREFTGRALS